MRTTLVTMMLLVASCGDANQLWGSIREDHPMEFDRVEVVRQGHALRIEYIRDRGRDSEWVCKLTLDTEGLDLCDHAEITATSFAERVVVERNADDALPRYTGGLLYFERYGASPGRAIEGDFNVLFDNGRNLAGSFATQLQVEDTGELVPGPGQQTPLLAPNEEDTPLADRTVMGTCAAGSPHGAIVGLWLVRLFGRRRNATSRVRR